MTTYRILGTSDDVTTCDCCGRANLKSTVILAALDADGNALAETYFGTTCAAKAAGQPVRVIKATLSAVSALREARAHHAEWNHPLCAARDAEMDRVNATGEMRYERRMAMLAEFDRLDAIIRADVKSAVRLAGVTL